MQTNTHDLILKLKTIREERGLSPQKIYDMLDIAGYHVSLNSVKRVFEPGSEDKHFRFQETVAPISQVLLGIYGNGSGDTEADALRADIRVKAELIAQLEHQLAECKADNSKRHEFLMRQITLKDERIDRLMTRVDGVLESNKELTKQLQRLIEKM